MGIWWHVSNYIPYDEHPLTFEGDKKALPKWIPFLWRFQHKWTILECANFDLVHAYELFFRTTYGTWLYHRPINSRYVGMRVGRGTVRYFARTVEHDTLRLVKKAGPYSYRERPTFINEAGDLTYV